MNELWKLPQSVQIGGKSYEINADFREILKILAVLDDPGYPEFLRWQVALRLFYKGELPPDREAMEYLSFFLRYGAEDIPGPRLLDWEQDAAVIISEVNKAAGQEVRSLEFVHWWTFLGWFHAIGDGQLATLISLRDKLRRGKPLEDWERDFYRQNKARIELKKRLSAQEQAERDALNRLLGN